MPLIPREICLILKNKLGPGKPCQKFGDMLDFDKIWWVLTEASEILEQELIRNNSCLQYLIWVQALGQVWGSNCKIVAKPGC